ncbi:MAG: AAA family ATPase, partial [Candidatus Peribacteraceae bacterium]|nr:AAA family ATPase [Candidatus Peribacteraceae bacterium]
TSVKQFGAWLNQPVMRFNGKDGIEASSFLGYPWATKGGMEWRDGMLPIGVRKGYLVTVDEVFKIPAGIQMAMQNLYEEGGYLTLDDNPDMSEKNVYPHDNFRMYLTDNVKGTGDDFDKFSATQVQDSSTLDRFGITATVQYLPHRDEVAMLHAKYPKVEESVIKSLVRFAGLIRDSYAKGGLSLTISPRGLQTMCEVLMMDIKIEAAVKMVYLDKVGDMDELTTANEAVRACF